MHRTVADGGLVLDVTIKPETLAQLREVGAPADDKQAPIAIGLIDGPGDRYVVTAGDAKGMTGFFARDDAGVVTGIHVGGRLATRSAG